MAELGGDISFLLGAMLGVPYTDRLVQAQHDYYTEVYKAHREVSEAPEAFADMVSSVMAQTVIVPMLFAIYFELPEEDRNAIKAFTTRNAQ